MNIRKGDQVKILTGKDRGKSGPVLRVETQTSRVTIEGFNLYKKRVRPKAAGAKGEMVSLPRAIPVSNVMVVCPICKKPTRVGHVFLSAGGGSTSGGEGGKKMRLCRKCKATF